MSEAVLQNPCQNKLIGVGEIPGIILAVADAKRRAAYLSAISRGAELTLAERIGDIPKLLRQVSCRGILIDIVLKIKASHMDKVRISDSIEAMPSATLKLDSRNGTIQVLMLNQLYGVARNVDEFTALCASFQPAPIYPQDLSSLRLNAIIAKTPDFEADAEKSITMSISGSGCFLFTATPERYEQGSAIWIDFVGITDRSPVTGRVCWQCPWGVSHKVSGIYVEFESIREEQYDEITNLVAKERNKPLFKGVL